MRASTSCARVASVSVILPSRTIETAKRSLKAARANESTIWHKNSPCEIEPEKGKETKQTVTFLTGKKEQFFARMESSWEKRTSELSP